MFVVTDDGARIFAPAFGPADPAGPAPVVGLGGWIADWQPWLPLFAHLSRSRRVVGIDHRGAGATIVPDAPITLERLVADIVAVLDAHGIERCVLASESMGAQAAIAAALAHPSRVERLILVAPLAGEDGGAAWRPGVTVPTPPPPSDASADSPYEAAVRADFEAVKRRFVAACLPEPDAGPLHPWAYQLLGGGTPESGIELLRLRRSLDLRPAAGDLHLPTLVVHGDADVLVPLDAGRALAAAIPGARLAVIAGAGHAPTMTRPAAVTAAIEAFLAEPA